MLLEYSIIMNSSNTVSKGEEWVCMVKLLIKLYTSIRSPLSIKYNAALIKSIKYKAPVS